MNERIKELLYKAGGEYGGEHHTTGQTVIYTDGVDCEKFAELIVEECIRVPYDMWDKAELNADVAVKIEHRIKEHFGVEE